MHPLYLPGEFEGHPLRKDFPLLARHVKPWPCVVDIEDIPEHLEAELEAQVIAAFEAAGGGELQQLLIVINSRTFPRRPQMLE